MRFGQSFGHSSKLLSTAAARCSRLSLLCCREGHTSRPAKYFRRGPEQARRRLRRCAAWCEEASWWCILRHWTNVRGIVYRCLLPFLLVFRRWSPWGPGKTTFKGLEDGWSPFHWTAIDGTLEKYGLVRMIDSIVTAGWPFISEWTSNNRTDRTTWAANCNTSVFSTLLLEGVLVLGFEMAVKSSRQTVHSKKKLPSDSMKPFFTCGILHLVYA